MKILLATGLFPPQIGGPATYAKLLHDELPKRGIEVEVVTFGDYLDKPKVIRHFLYFRELLRKSPEVDLIYALDPVSVGLPALFASQIRDKKFVLRIAGDYAWEQGSQRWNVTDTLDDFVKEHEKYSWQVRLLKKIQRYVAAAAHRIIVPSVYLKNIVSQWDINSAKISVVYNGFHVESSKTLKTTLRKRFNFVGPIIVSAARLVPWKGMKELIEIMPDIVAEFPEAKLAIIGNGPQKRELEAKITELKLEASVGLTGRLDQRELFEYIKAADLFVLNTGYEGLSHQILETMAIGTPVITTDVGGNPEIIKHGKNGILLRPNDRKAFTQAIIEMLGERAISFMIAKEAKKTVAQFTDEAMLEKISQELKKI
jgi:glycosyltransferase involved in cell wall biosynthesis